MHAIESGDVDDVRKIIEKNGINPIHAAKDSGSSSPLHRASTEGGGKIIKYLLKNTGVDVNLQTKKNGLTPLHCVCAKFSESQHTTIKLLLRKGANPNIKDKYGATPLHYASYQGRDGAVKLLLESGAKPNIINNDGKTPKMYALNRGNFFCYEILEAAEQEIILYKGVNAEHLEAVEAEVILLDDVEEQRCHVAAKKANENERQAAEIQEKEDKKHRKKFLKQIKKEQQKQEIGKVETENRRQREVFLVSDKCSTLNFKICNRTTGKSTYLLLAVSPDMTLQSLYSKMTGLDVKKFPKEEHLGIKDGSRTVYLRITDPSLKHEYFLVPRERFDQFTAVDIIDNLPQSSRNPVHAELFSDPNASDDDCSLFDASFSVRTETTRFSRAGTASTEN